LDILLRHAVILDILLHHRTFSSLAVMAVDGGVH
jgi:hypothetical protein